MISMPGISEIIVVIAVLAVIIGIGALLVRAFRK
ncbi:hypothetical protein SAMN05421805_12551 [Saccharopolyspora antimicrobica]|uniref:Uncharacterized protein n=1 Tax=Saccharopolyspora antimicrobica TaxID=455193 RepID=A0A1I5K457_9PSEU|nr:hypothetical protein ATL45_3118 [Saccharopolyspora antimicrobica]SFO79835.1 hypothetical protein SAMN05421805_12551 [Saccharopolyspora antimicrobica]